MSSVLSVLLPAQEKWDPGSVFLSAADFFRACQEGRTPVLPSIRKNEFSVSEYAAAGFPDFQYALDNLRGSALVVEPRLRSIRNDRR